MNETVTELKFDLPRRLEALVSDRHDAAEFLRALTALCEATPEAPWETLALVDQYYRRGRLSSELFKAARTSIERRVLGFQDPVILAVSPPAAVLTTVASAAAVTPGDRQWRSLHAELASARKHAALYLERLAANDWRSSSLAYLAAAQLTPPEPANRTPRRWATPLAARRVPALLAVALAVVTAALLVTAQTPRAAASRPPPPTSAPLPVRAALPAPQPGLLAFDSERYLVAPHGAEALLTVRRSGGSDGLVSFDWWTADLGARAGRDFRSAGRRTVTLADGQDSARIAVAILGNPERRHTEMFAVRIAAPGGGAALGEVAQATVFILPPDR